MTRNTNRKGAKFLKNQSWDIFNNVHDPCADGARPASMDRPQSCEQLTESPMTEHPIRDPEFKFNAKAGGSGLSSAQAASVSSDHAYVHSCFQRYSSLKTEELQHHLLRVL